MLIHIYSYEKTRTPYLAAKIHRSFGLF